MDGSGAGGGGGGDFEGLLERLSDQHKQFLEKAASEVFATLRKENARLNEENSRLQTALEVSQVQESEPEPPVLSPLRRSGVKVKPLNAVWEPPGTPHGEAVASPVSPTATSSALRRRSRHAPPIPPLPTALPGFVPQPPSADGDAGGFAMEATDSALSGMHRRGDRHVQWASQRSNGHGHLPRKTANGPLDDAERIHITKEKRRLRNVFRLRAGETWVTQESLFSMLSSRAPTDHAAVASVVRELKGIYSTMKPEEAWRDEQVPAYAISLDALADLLLTQNLLDYVSGEAVEDVLHVMSALQLQTVDDVVDEATRISNNQAPRTQTKMTWEWPLNIVVSTTVIINLLAMGISLDFDDPDKFGWVVLEGFCVAVFISETALKMWFWRCKYFRGDAAYWNIADFVITVTSVIELVFTIIQWSVSEDSPDGQISGSASRVVIMARALRCARVVRLMKLLHSPILRDLANMLVGFVIGLPSLAWTLVLFLLILYMLGIVFRQAFGPYPGQNLIAQCGYGDDMTDFLDEVCKVHWMYGEEFFGDVRTAMFTSFRFMLGDYSSRGGKSLVVAFSRGFGERFDVLFVSWMVVVIFGLFNIITAIFVDSTISGLKHNDVKRKYARQYERSYVQAKLKELVARLQLLHETKLGVYHDDHISGRSSRVGAIAASEVELDEEEFVEVMGDEIVMGLLNDLDVAMLHPEAMFDTFDPDGNGNVSLYELVQAILKLRGEPQKGDMIATWVSLKSLHEKMDTFSAVMKEQEWGHSPGHARLS